MAERLYPTKHTTIGSIIDAGLKIHGFCLDCGHEEDLDLDEIARLLGRNQSSLPVHLVPKLVCSICGSKNVGTVLVAADKMSARKDINHVKEEWRRQE